LTRVGHLTLELTKYIKTLWDLPPDIHICEFCLNNVPNGTLVTVIQAGLILENFGDYSIYLYNSKIESVMLIDFYIK